MAPKRYVEKGIVWGVGLAIAAALVVRLFFTISLYDEVLNIRISYLTAVMGQRHCRKRAYLPWGMCLIFPLCGSIIN